MDISVIGCGRWGTFLAWYLDSLSHKVTLYGREESEKYKELLNCRTNEYVNLPTTIHLTSDLEKAVKSSIIIVSIGSQNLRDLCRQLAQIKIRDKIIVLCMKGLEIGSGTRLSQVAKEELDASNRIAIWIGPGHIQDFCNGVPGSMVIDSDDEYTTRFLVDKFSGNLIRFYYGSDMVGNEVGAALKNVIGIAAGILDGLGYTSLKGALMTRGAKEVSRLIEAMGGNPLSAYGLCHLGDYEATLFSEHSHNRQFGIGVVNNSSFNKLAEGYYTVKAVAKLADDYGVSMPICEAIYGILYKNVEPKVALGMLFDRRLKKEF